MNAESKKWRVACFRLIMINDSNSMVGKISKNLTFIVLLSLMHHIAEANGWRAFPNLRVGETFSDNINLSPSGNKRSAFVTEISPSISISNRAGLNRLNLNYRLQGLYNSGGNESFNVFHQLQFNSNSILRRNSLYLNLRSTISQQNLTNIRAANDNITGGQNRTNVYTYGVSPMWTPRFNGYAFGIFRFDFDGVNFSNELPENSGVTASPATNSKTYQGTASLSSGWRFSRFRWSLNYRNRQEDRSDGDDVKSQNASGRIRISMNRYLSVFGQGGYIDNQFQSNTDVNQNGFFYTVGARWRPSSRFSVEGGYGNNSYATISIWPTRYMQWSVTYRNNDIGTNTGDVWQASFRYNTKRSIWFASYFEDTTTTQSVLSNLTVFNNLDQFGDPIQDPVPQQQVQFDTSLPTLTNEVFIRKRADINYSYRNGKSLWNLSLFGEKRDFQVQLNNEEVFGVNGSWNWSFTRNTWMILTPSWQYIRRTDSSSEESNDHRIGINFSMNRRIPVRLGRGNQMNARLEYRYLDQISTIEVNEFTENRVTLSLLLRF